MLDSLCLIADVTGDLRLLGQGDISKITMESGSRILYFPSSNRIELSISIGGSAQENYKETVQILKDELSRTELKQYAKLQASFGYMVSIDLSTSQWKHNPIILLGVNAGYSLGDSLSLFQYGIWNYNKRDVLTTFTGARYQIPGMNIPIPNFLQGINIGGKVSIALKNDAPITGIERNKQLQIINEYKNVFADSNDEAIQLATQTLKWNPNDFQALLSRAIAYDRLGKHDLAVSDAKRIIDSTSTYTSADHMSTRAYAFMTIGDFEQALNEAFNCLRVDVNNLQACLVIANISLTRNDINNLMKFTSRALELDRQNSFAYRLRAAGYLRFDDKLELGIQDASNSISLDRHPFAYYVRANLYYKTNNHEKAFEDINQTIRMAPWVAQYWGRRGLWETIRENYQTAMQDANQCLNIDPKDPTGLSARIIALKNTGNIMGALKDARKLLELEPNNDAVREFIKENS